MILLLVAYCVVLALLFTYGARGYVMALLALRARPAPPTARRLADPPMVTIQLPIYNERYVLPRLLERVAALEWPRDRLHVQLLDDSDDETRLLAAEQVAHWRARGLDVAHVVRADRRDFKAGALAVGLAQARGDLVCIFDADFAPMPDFLHRMVPHLLDDAGLACVQARWGHVNEDYSWITRAQAIGVDGHFAVEQAVRSDRGLLMNFNGTAGVWRKRAILDAGGWSGDTVAEDLDLSYRAQLKGWRLRYVQDAVAPAEIPAQMHAFKRQQYRWAKGSIQCMRKHAWGVLRSSLRPTQKLEAMLHLSHYAVHPLMLALSLMLLPLTLSAPVPLAFALTLFGATFGPPAMYLTAQRILHPDAWRSRAPRLLPLTLLGMGIALSNTRAVLDGLSRWGGEFRRTPKFRIETRADVWRGKAYALGPDWSIVGEAALVLLMFGTIATALATGRLAVLPWAILFFASYSTVLVVSIMHRVGGAKPTRSGNVPTPE